MQVNRGAAIQVDVDRHRIEMAERVMEGANILRSAKIDAAGAEAVIDCFLIEGRYAPIVAYRIDVA
jgi:hypothetical protein